MRVAGIMSGTSLDGMDVAVVDIRGRAMNVIAHSTTPYPEKVRARILAVSNTQTHTAEISRVNFLLPELYAKAVRRCGVPLDSIELVGCHGQTVFHEERSTLQLGDGSVLAERLGIPVVSDFRPRDMAAGGKGAPLVPFVDYRLYAHRKLGRVALNIGGIANITAIPAGATPEDVVAFDTGPGNMVIDQLVAIHTDGRQNFDAGGAIAAEGRLNQKLLDRLLRAPYFRRKPPKTAGREQYGHEFVAELIATGESVPNLIATATALTAASIAAGVQRFVSHATDEVIVSGGGAHNRVMMAYLQAFLPTAKLRISSEFGIDSDAKEAIAFAVLAYETWNRRPSNLPSATGARRPVVLGKISY
ncbi:MAG TPA: anhydro-N-acetylmuramic acid kinase [Bryobacteraceae bacterium]|nr:anhydro-N-acetylmuramic acid kinase [Bryobacteraceae bacterium]